MGGKPHGTHHPQRVVAEGDVGVERRADDATLQVTDAVKRVEQFTIALLVQADCHRVDGEVAAFLVVIEGAVFHDGIAALAVIGLAAGAHKLQLPLARLDLGGAVGAEHCQMGALADASGNGFGDLDAATHGDEVHVVAGAFQEDIPHISAHDVALAVQLVGDFAHQLHHGPIHVLGYFLSVDFHVFLLWDCKITAFFALFLLML